jgi:hypothetical protein
MQPEQIGILVTVFEFVPQVTIFNQLNIVCSSFCTLLVLQKKIPSVVDQLSKTLTLLLMVVGSIPVVAM